MPHCAPQEYHTENDGQGSNYRRTSHFNNLLETEFQSERKQKHDNSDLCPNLNTVHILYRRSILKMRSGDKTSHYVTQDERLFQAPEKKGYKTGHDQYHGQILYQRGDMLFHNSTIFSL